MSMFTLGISRLTITNLPWFMDLIFQVPMKYCSLEHGILFSPPDTSTTACHFRFGPAASFILELLAIALRSSPVAYWTPSNLGGAHLLVSYLSAFSYYSWGSHSQNTGVVCHSLLQWTTLSQNSSLWPFHPGWPCTIWLIASLSYANPFITTEITLNPLLAFEEGVHANIYFCLHLI